MAAFHFSLFVFSVVSLCFADDPSTFDIKPEPIPILDHWWGSQAVNDDNRIVGGQEAWIEDHPYQVSFIVNNSYFCGGFIVSEIYILTAAHCAQDVDPTTVVLRAGSSSRKNGTIIPIAEVIPHPEYDDPPFDKDVAVMKTVEPITFSDTMQPIPLPKLGRPMRGGTKIMVSGWGRTKQGASSIPERLMDVEIPVVYYAACLASYPGILTHNMWCGGNYFLGGQGTCQTGYSLKVHQLQSRHYVHCSSFVVRVPRPLLERVASADFWPKGVVFRRFRGSLPNPTPEAVALRKIIVKGDSGGAAIQDGVAVGIVSFGRGCAQPLSPSVFADIAAPTIRNFITQHTGL